MMSFITEILTFLGITGAVLATAKADAAISPVQEQAKHTMGDLDALARTIWGEARGEGYKGMQAVANVVMNRYSLAQSNAAYARQFGRTVEEIVKKPYQFSVWNYNDPNRQKIMEVTHNDPQYRIAVDIARNALEGNLSDITGGADHYHTASINPNWADEKLLNGQIGVHKFYRLA